jgi:hypothetical protein
MSICAAFRIHVYRTKTDDSENRMKSSLPDVPTKVEWLLLETDVTTFHFLLSHPWFHELCSFLYFSLFPFLLPCLLSMAPDKLNYVRRGWKADTRNSSNKSISMDLYLFEIISFTLSLFYSFFSRMTELMKHFINFFLLSFTSEINLLVSWLFITLQLAFWK